MKIYHYFFFFVLISFSVFSQNGNYTKAFDDFIEAYNEEDFVAIFESFSSEMQESLPLEDTQQFFGELKYQAGKIISKDFLNDEDGTGAIYKVNLEWTALSFYISLNDANKFEVLLIKPYEEAVEDQNLINDLRAYPAEVAALLYSTHQDLPKNAQLSVAVINHNKVDFYGSLSKGDTIVCTNNQKNVFEIGSLTKVFTSTILALLVEEGKLNLSDEAQSFFDFKFNEEHSIPLERLANHTSGLARLPINLNLTDFANPYKNYGKGELEDYLKNYLSIEESNLGKYAYSNLGAGLLGYVLGLSEAMSFQELLQKRIFEEWEMSSSYTSLDNVSNKLIRGLNQNGEVVSNWEFDVLVGAGGILSTSEDLSKFIQAHFDEKNIAFSKTLSSTYTIDVNYEIGLGWHIVKQNDGRKFFFHNGGTGGYSSVMLLDVANKIGVVVLANVANSNTQIDELGFKLMNEIKMK